jgi:hypothetical protein
MGAHDAVVDLAVLHDDGEVSTWVLKQFQAGEGVSVDEVRNPAIVRSRSDR